MSKGLLIVVSGPSGAGKGTVIARLRQNHPEIFLSVSATTRPPREREQEGIHYFFTDKTGFEEHIKSGEMLEYAKFAGNYYGTPLPPVMQKLDSGVDVLLEIEVQGGAQVREKYPDAVFIFIAPPGIAELRRRLEKRGTESADVIERRLSAAITELKEHTKYDYVVVNENPDQAAADIEAIIRAAKLSIKHMKELDL